MTQFPSAAAQLNSHVFSDHEKEARFVQYNQNEKDKQINKCQQVRSKTLLEIEHVTRRAEKLILDGKSKEEQICAQMKEDNDDQATNNTVRERLDAMFRNTATARSAYQYYNKEVNSYFPHTAQCFSLLYLARHTLLPYMVSTCTLWKRRSDFEAFELECEIYPLLI